MVIRGDERLRLLVCCLMELRRWEASWFVKVMLLCLKEDWREGSSCFLDLLAVEVVWV